MRQRKICLSFLIALMFNSCSTPVDEAVEYVDVDGEKVSKIHPEMIRDKTEIKFSDWFEDIRLIELESIKGSLIRHVMRSYIGEDYILISTIDNGILLFSAEGKFIRAIAPHGKGPCEVTDANRNIFVDEKNHKLYCTDLQLYKKEVVCIDIKTGECKTIPLKFTGNEIGIRDIIVLQDSLMYCTTMQFASGKSHSPVFCQTTTGKLLWELEKIHPLGLHDGGIRLVGDKMYFNYHFAGDTIYQIENQDLKPIVILASERPRSYLEEKVGSIYMGLTPINDTWFQGSWSTIEEMIFDERYNSERAKTSERTGFLFNIKTGQAQNFGEIKNDYLGWDEDFYLQFHHNGIGVATYEAIDLIEKADSVLKLPDISIELKARLESILATVDENDNPYLLVGKLKL